MDQNFDIHLVEEEEEKSGWTILSTVCGEKLNELKAQGADPEQDKDSVESLRATDIAPLSSEEKSNDDDELSDDGEEVVLLEGDDDADDELTEYGVDEGGEEEGSPFSDTAPRAYVWETAPIGGEAIGKQTLVEQQPVQKQGLIWRVSLVATLGLFGWAVLSGLGNGGKTIRCFKMQPCSLKEGEPVLSTI